MLQFSQCDRAVARIALCALLVTLPGCRKRPVVVGSPGPTLSGNPRAADDDIKALYDSYKWDKRYADITGYNDEQKLTIGASPKYGPKVRLYVNPTLRNFTMGDFDQPNGQIVGAAEVYPNPNGPQASVYDLNFRNSTATEVYCVYLSHGGTDPFSGWSGAVTSFSKSGGCAVPTQQDGLPGHVDPSSSNGTPDAFPAVVRFTTDDLFRPAIAIPCLAALCELSKGNPVPIPFQGGKSEVWQVRNWHDQQVLSQPAGSTTVQPWATGMVVPVEGLANITIPQYQSGWRRVATLWLSAPPPAGTTYDKWGTGPGENWVWLRDQPSGWEATFTSKNLQPGSSARRFQVDRIDWSPLKLAGTARFVWDDADELMWVACESGCCTVSGTQLQ